MNRYSISQAAAVIVLPLLAACGASPAAGGYVPGEMGARAANAHASPERARSWLKAGAANQTLLYVTDVGGVTVYSNTGGENFQLVGELFGFALPAGACTDARGDIFIADNGAQVIDEYAHGAITPEKVIPDSAGRPLDCSVDRKSGRIAVTNDLNPSGNEPGNVVIYPSPSGTPTEYTDSHLYAPLYCSFDRKGNLYLDAYDSGFHPVLSELPNGGQSFTILTLSGGSWLVPSGLLTNGGSNLLIGDLYDRNTHIYEAGVKGTTATITATIPLSKTKYLGKFTLFGFGSATVILAPDNSSNNVQIYSYPSGAWITSVTNGVSQPLAAIVSPGK
ncbi:MAG: hypothetical protein WB609_00165 [Candidatus Cybelea sp.]